MIRSTFVGGCGRTLVVLAGLAMTACSEGEQAFSTGPAAVTASPRPGFKVQTFLPEQPAPPALPAGAQAGSERADDPSAPLDTPLCGRVDREASAAGAAISPAMTTSGNACLGNACFDPSTDTYIGADGYRHVCQ